MNFISKIILSIIFINFVFVLFFTDHILRNEQKEQLSNLHDKIKQDKQILQKINSVALYDLDIYTLNTNLKTFFNTKEIVRIEIQDNLGVYINFEDKNYDKKETIKSTIDLGYENEKLGLITILYSKAQINKQFEEFKTELTTFSIILTVVLSLIIYLLIKQFTKPIIELSRATDKIAMGDLECEININHKDEIGNLANKFRHMQESLKDKINSLSSKNDELLNEINQKSKIQKNLLEAYNIINKSPAVVFLWKNKVGFPVEYVSSNVCHLFGYSEECFIRNRVSFKDIILDDYLKKTIYKMIETQNTLMINFTDFENKPFQIKTKEGFVKWISIKTYEKLDSNGNITHFQGLILDVTSEISTLNKLSESKLHYQNLIENNIAAIIIKTNKNKISMTNKKARELLGLTDNQLEGIEVLPLNWKILNAQGQEIGLEQMPSNRIFETKSNIFNEIIGILHSKNEDIVWILVNAYAEFNSHGEIQRVISTSIDISEIKKAENKINSLNSELETRVKNRTKELTKSKKELQETISTLQQAQEQLVQNEKMASLGNLVAGVAHEINTPVGTGLTGITHLVWETQNLEKLYKNNEMTQEEFEEYIVTLKDIGESVTISLRQAANLISSFKQVAVDQSYSEIREFNVKKYIDEILLSIKTKIKETNIKVKVDCSHDVILNSYPGAFSQVITNLVMNSLVHAFNKEDNGLIAIEVLEENENIKIIYRDDGNGISKENLIKIYEPFFTTKRAQGGSGLGMHIIYNIINSNLYGKINCVSKEGLGVMFVIYMKKDLDSI